MLVARTTASINSGRSAAILTHDALAPAETTTPGWPTSSTSATMSSASVPMS